MMNLFALARAGESLTPTQRAALRAVETAMATIGLAVLYAAAQYLGGHDLASINPADFGRFMAGAAMLAAVMVGIKWVKAHLDPAIGAALDPVAQNAEGAIQQWADIPNDVVTEIDEHTDTPALSAEPPAE
jgi:hypothetical protein